MPKFESSISSKQVTNQPMRDISVPDETNYTQHTRHYGQPPIDDAAFNEFQANMQSPQNMRNVSAAEQEILLAKKAKREGKERLSEGARRRIEMLIGMTRLTKDIDISGQHYQLKSLTGEELRSAMTSAAEFDGSVEFIFETRKQLLARSLTIVANVEITQFLNSDDLESRLYFIEQMDHALLLRLYNEYITLANEAQEKYSIKKVEEVKEVLEDLKK